MPYTLDLRKKVGHDPIFMPCAGCAIIKDNQILLQKRNDNGKWALHGGSLELGETFLEAVQREVKEEINVEIVNPKLVNMYSGEDMHFFYPNNDEVYGVAAIYLVQEYKGELKFDPEEVLEIKWFDINDLPENLHTVDIKPIKDAIEMYKGM
ncbi:MAG: NUDIX domain-containing protein [Clostridia bacterium]|nr:NUDIX domain-containing protein [Clostridia bacterium]